MYGLHILLLNAVLKWVNDDDLTRDLHLPLLIQRLGDGMNNRSVWIVEENHSSTPATTRVRSQTLTSPTRMSAASSFIKRIIRFFAVLSVSKQQNAGRGLQSTTIHRKVMQRPKLVKLRRTYTKRCVHID